MIKARAKGMGATEAEARAVKNCISSVGYQIGCVALGTTRAGKEGIAAGGDG